MRKYENIPSKNMLFTNKALRTLVVPLLIEQLLAVTVGMADTMMVSHAGEAAVSGVSLVDMINNVIISLLAALATGGAVIISQSIGARREKEAEEASAQLYLMTFMVAMLITVLTVAFSSQVILGLFGSIESDVFKACHTYLILTAFGFPLLAIYNAGAALFRSVGDSKTSMKVSLLMNIINVAGNAICVFGLGMDVAGVAIPSVISRGVAALLMTWLATKENRYGVVLKIKKIFTLDMGIMRRILYIGIPSGIENSLFQVGRVAVVSIIAGFGTVEIAANAVANNLDGVAITFGGALSIAMVTVVGRCIGAKEYTQARYYTIKLLRWAYVAVLIPCAMILSFRYKLYDLYNISEQTKQLTNTLVLIHQIPAMCIWPVSFVLPNALRAGNDVRFTMGISLFSMAFFRFGTSIFLAHVFGIGAIGVWCAMVLDWIFRMINFSIRFKGEKWYQIAKSD